MVKKTKSEISIEKEESEADFSYDSNEDEDSESDADEKPSNSNRKNPKKRVTNRTKTGKTKLTKKILKPRFRTPVVKKNSAARGVVYLGSIPHGFYEKEMRSYFSQFGKVTAINIPRSKKTGKYKGFGFVEFLYPEVAKIVAETMDNHLMCNKIMKAKYIPPEKQKPYFFKHVYPRIPLVQKRRMYLTQMNHKLRDEKQTTKETEALKKNFVRISNKLQKIGLENYTFTVGCIPTEFQNAPALM